MFAAINIEFYRFFLFWWQVAVASFKLLFLGTAIICSFTVKCHIHFHLQLNCYFCFASLFCVQLTKVLEEIEILRYLSW
jgi:hypothetical protein